LELDLPLFVESALYILLIFDRLSARGGDFTKNIQQTSVI
jgi:hypothetical protein